MIVEKSWNMNMNVMEFFFPFLPPKFYQIIYTFFADIKKFSIGIESSHFPQILGREMVVEKRETVMEKSWGKNWQSV